MKLYDLFTRCLTIPYTKVGLSADYAAEIIDGTLYIYFQDSDGIEDWKSNLNFPCKPYKSMDNEVWYAHRGFLDVWKELEPYVSKLIFDMNIRSIVITGYSHGAAIAVLCHEYVYFHRPDIRKHIRGYGFGCPRVLWGFISAELKQRWENFTVIRNIDDPVTHLPPAIMGYSHAGKMLEIGAKGKYKNIEAHIAKNIQRELLIYESGDKYWS